MEHSKPALLESVSLEEALSDATFHLSHARVRVGKLYAELMAGGSVSITSLVYEAQELAADLQRIETLAYVFVANPSNAASWHEALKTFLDRSRTAAALRLAESAPPVVVTDTEVPF